MRTPSPNPLKTKSDLQKAFLELEAPLLSAWDHDSTAPTVGLYRARYSMPVTRLETLARYLWGLAPFAAGGGVSKGWSMMLDGISHGTDPNHPGYWGPVKDIDQRSVEMASFGVALRIVPDKIWAPLSGDQKDKFAAWLSTMLDQPLVKNNWQFFRLMLTMGLRHIGRVPKNIDQIEQETIDIIETFYLDNGWYNDGGQRDYYVPWAFHFYSLLASKLCVEGPVMKRIPEWRKRSERFSHEFAHWFSSDGAALPFGRSLTYRFAQSAYWGAAGVASLPGMTPGDHKGFLLRNIRWWFKQPFLTPDGYVSLGYCYPNIIMCEPYNAQGSPYWAFKALAPLQLPDDHEFWTTQESQPKLPGRAVQPEPRMVIDRDEGSGQIIAHTCGQWHSWALRHRDAKYAKFAYSTYFGPCVGSNFDWLAGVGLDNTLSILPMETVPENGEKWQNHGLSANHRTEDLYLVSDWASIPGVAVRTWVIPLGTWQVRVHRVVNDRTIHLAEGGFSAEDPQIAAKTDTSLCLRDARGGLSGLINLQGDRKISVNDFEPNSSLYHSCVRGPMLLGKIPAGATWLATAVLGAAPGSKATFEEQPKIYLEADTGITLWLGDKKIYVDLRP